MRNIVIRQLIAYDFLIQFAVGLLSPIFAVFLLNNIPGSTLKVVGLATTFYWIARITSTVPLSRLMDRLNGERDEFYFIIVGSAIVSTVPLLYLLADQPWHIYIIQFIFGLANSFAVPAWRILFIDHLDKGKTGFEFSINDVANGVAIGLAAFIGSVLADAFGFTVLFILLAIMGYSATLMLIPIYSETFSSAQKKIIAAQKRRRTLLHVRGA